MIEYLQVYTVSFFGHREIDHFFKAEEQTERIIRKLLDEHPFVEFFVGRDGEYDQIVSSAIRRIKERCGSECICHTFVLPYPKAEYINNIESFKEYYDEIEICEASAEAHPKAAIQIRNRAMVDPPILLCVALNITTAELARPFDMLRYRENRSSMLWTLKTTQSSNRHLFVQWISLSSNLTI